MQPTEFDPTVWTSPTMGMAIELIKQKLDRIIAKLIESRSQQMTEADQWAIRILKSRKRELDRAYLYRYGDDKAKFCATLELSLAKRDMGELIVIDGRKHGVGRLFSCQACTKNENGQLQARLCPHCKSGVQHSFKTHIQVQGGDVPIPEEGEIRTITFNQQPGEVKTYSVNYKIGFKCDNCGVEGPEA